MNLLNMVVPKDSISMIFDPVGDVENYNTTLLLHKSEIELAEEDNEFSKHVVLDLNKKDKNDKMMKLMCNQSYGTFLLDFLNADFSNAESAYNSFLCTMELKELEVYMILKESIQLSTLQDMYQLRNF